MKIGILRCDEPQPQHIQQFGSYVDMLIVLFKQVDKTLEFICYDVEKGDYPRDIDECDAYVTTGSKASASDDLPWIKTLEQFIVQLQANNKKLIAICFGHQLVAKALGGKVETSDKGWGVGVHSSRIINAQPWMQPQLDSYNVVVSHQDQVIQLPDNVILIASNEFCPNAAFQVGAILSFQGHPEFSKSFSRALMQQLRPHLGEQVYIQGIKSLEKPTDSLIVAQWMVKFIRSK